MGPSKKGHNFARQNLDVKTQNCYRWACLSKINIYPWSDAFRSFRANMNSTMTATKLVVCGNRVEDVGIFWNARYSNETTIKYSKQQVQQVILRPIKNRWSLILLYLHPLNDVTSNSLPCLFSLPDSKRINHESILIGIKIETCQSH